MNPVYSPAPTGVPFTNTKGISYPGNIMCICVMVYAHCIVFIHKHSCCKLYIRHPESIDFFLHTAGFPVGYAAAAPAYSPSMYAGANAAFPSGEEDFKLNVMKLLEVHTWHILTTRDLVVIFFCDGCVSALL